MNIGGVPEYRFHPTRKWRFDFAWPENKRAMEVEGGVWTGGRHTRGSGFLKDCEKYNAAASLGWRVFRFTPIQVRRLEHVPVILEAIKSKDFYKSNYLTEEKKEFVNLQ
jgi:very-short-patch-repair endonuclease